MLLFLICVLLWCKAAQPSQRVQSNRAQRVRRKEQPKPQKEIDYELAFELQQRLAYVEEEISHYKETLAKLQQDEFSLGYKLHYYEQLGLPHKALTEKHDKLLEKVWSEKQKLSKAELNKISIERRLNKCISR